jgi:hypothetical protein
MAGWATTPGTSGVVELAVSVVVEIANPAIRTLKISRRRVRMILPR